MGTIVTTVFSMIYYNICNVYISYFIKSILKGSFMPVKEKPKKIYSL